MRLPRQDPERVLAPLIAVVFVAGLGSAAIYEEREASGSAAGTPTSTTSTTAGSGDDTVADDSTTTTGAGGSSTTTTRPGATTTTRPGATTTRPSTGTTTPTTAGGGGTTPTTAAPPAEPADLIVHMIGSGPITVQVENAGPGAAPDIRVVLTGFEGLDATDVTVHDGVDCFGEGTVTCTVAASGVGGIVGELDVQVPAGACLVATATSSAEEPHPGDNTRQRATEGGSC